jgi:hypothetical protein
LLSPSGCPGDEESSTAQPAPISPALMRSNLVYRRLW